jgi:aspartyl-tRNA(Asn)/glutamyl-tRNA(Gln) amidotransferase subunit C
MTAPTQPPLAAAHRGRYNPGSLNRALGEAARPGTCVAAARRVRTVISREEVVHVARLARLHFEEDELVRLEGELSKIIDYINQLGELDLTGVPTTAHAVAVKNVLRPDEPRPGLTQEEALMNGPDVERGHFAVPRMG